MSSQLETIVREAQQRMAERAPHPDHVRAALPARRLQLVRRRRITVGLTALAAFVAVVAAVAVPLTGLGRGASTIPPGTEPTGGTFLALPLRYGPTWLPAGLAERTRMLTVEGGSGIQWPAVSRTWTVDPVGTSLVDTGGPRVEFLLVPRLDGAPQHQGEAVDIGGEPGVYASGPDTLVAWGHDGFQFMVGARGLPLSKEDMLRIARSVRPDTAVLRVPLAVGSWPDGALPAHVTMVGDSPASWFASVDAPLAPTGPGDVPSTLTISVGPTNPGHAGGEPLTVAGHPARFVKGNIGGGPAVHAYLLIVDIGRGLELAVMAVVGGAGSLTEDDLIRTAEAVTVDPNPDLGWLGGHP